MADKTINVKKGDLIPIDGTTAYLYLGQSKTVEPNTKSGGMPRQLATSAQKALAFAARSTCSSLKTVCPSCRQ